MDPRSIAPTRILFISALLFVIASAPIAHAKVFGAAGQWGQRPTVTSPGGTPPTQLQLRDLIAGSGAVAQRGVEVEVHYVGVAWSSGQEFDASWGHGRTFRFRLGGGQVIAGWDQGVVGMRVGGRRQLVIPPSMAYGARQVGASIGPNETLIFVVDLLAVHP